ncbi:hypothetical protein OXYTRIMIC_687 [Oxytricha trifallax]|uniref:Uncharacterized protein n=1 Tax=Oxytricha trifallax TaxID=1172189 RepID=A0A073IBH8_9SPIT|nr:hypothetical protein OXYTRIMIC_687 [Oxytricha trifallax]
MVIENVITLKYYVKYLVKHEDRLIGNNKVFSIHDGSVIQEFEEKFLFTNGLGLNDELLVMGCKNRLFQVYRWNSSKYILEQSRKYTSKSFTGPVLQMEKGIYDQFCCIYFLFQKQVQRIIIPEDGSLKNAVLEDLMNFKTRNIRYFKQLGPNLILTNDRFAAQIINTETKQPIHRYEYQSEGRYFCIPRDLDLQQKSFILYKSHNEMKLADIVSNKDKNFKHCKFEQRLIGYIDVSHPESMQVEPDTKYFMAKDKDQNVSFIKIRFKPEYKL